MLFHGCARRWISYRLAYHNIRMEIHGTSDDNTQPHLADNLESTGQSFLVFTEYLDVIVQKTYRSHPHRCDQHEDDINILELGEKERRHQNPCNDNQSAHGWCALFLFFTLKAQVSNGFTHLLGTQNTNQPTTIARSDD